MEIGKALFKQAVTKGRICRCGPTVPAPPPKHLGENPLTPITLLQQGRPGLIKPDTGATQNGAEGLVTQDRPPSQFHPVLGTPALLAAALEKLWTVLPVVLSRQWRTVRQAAPARPATGLLGRRRTPCSLAACIFCNAAILGSDPDQHHQQAATMEPTIANPDPRRAGRAAARLHPFGGRLGRVAGPTSWWRAPAHDLPACWRGGARRRDDLQFVPFGQACAGAQVHTSGQIS